MFSKSYSLINSPSLTKVRATLFFWADDWQALPTVMRHAIFNVIREALLNITKHAQATEGGIELTKKGKFWSLQIWDNGKGISQDRSTGLGLLHMKKSNQDVD